METSRWRTTTWFVLAMLILCAVVFGYGVATAPPCGSDCVGMHGADRVSYEASWRSIKAMQAPAFLAVLPLLFLSGLAWIVADIRRPRRLLCARCRAVVSPGAKFCPGCGQPLR